MTKRKSSPAIEENGTEKKKKAGFSGPSSALCPRDVRQTFHLRRCHAAFVLEITETCLKRIVEGRIPRWPYRKLKKLKNLRRFILDHSLLDAAQKQEVLDLIFSNAERLQSDPDYELCGEINKHSEHSYKLKGKLQSADDEGGDDAMTDDEDTIFWGSWAEDLERRREESEGSGVRLCWIHEAAASCLPAPPPRKRITPSNGTPASRRLQAKTILGKKGKAGKGKRQVATVKDVGDGNKEVSAQPIAVVAATIAPVQVSVSKGSKQPFEVKAVKTEGEEEVGGEKAVFAIPVPRALLGSAAAYPGPTAAPPSCGHLPIPFLALGEQPSSCRLPALQQGMEFMPHATAGQLAFPKDWEGGMGVSGGQQATHGFSVPPSLPLLYQQQLHFHQLHSQGLLGGSMATAGMMRPSWEPCDTERELIMEIEWRKRELSQSLAQLHRMQANTQAQNQFKRQKAHREGGEGSSMLYSSRQASASASHSLTTPLAPAVGEVGESTSSVAASHPPPSSADEGDAALDFGSAARAPPQLPPLSTSKPTTRPFPQASSVKAGRKGSQSQLSSEDSQLMQQQVEEADKFLAQDDNLHLLFV